MNEPVLTTISVVAAAALVAIFVIMVVRSAGERGLQRFAQMHGLDRTSGADDSSDAEQRGIDAQRSATIRGLINLPTVLAMLVGLLVASQLSALLEPAGVIVAMVAFLVFPGIVLTLAIIAASKSPELYYLKRLWPEQAARVAASFRSQSVEEHAHS